MFAQNEVRRWIEECPCEGAAARFQEAVIQNAQELANELVASWLKHMITKTEAASLASFRDGAAHSAPTTHTNLLEVPAAHVPQLPKAHAAVIVSLDEPDSLGKTAAAREQPLLDEDPEQQPELQNEILKYLQAGESTLACAPSSNSPRSSVSSMTTGFRESQAASFPKRLQQLVTPKTVRGGAANNCAPGAMMRWPSSAGSGEALGSMGAALSDVGTTSVRAWRSGGGRSSNGLGAASFEGRPPACGCVGPRQFGCKSQSQVLSNDDGAFADHELHVKLLMLQVIVSASACSVPLTCMTYFGIWRMLIAGKRSERSKRLVANGRLHLWPAWAEDYSPLNHPRTGRTKSKLSGCSETDPSKVRSGDAWQSNSPLRFLMWKPCSFVQLLWCSMSIIVVAYDMVVIPMEAFELGMEALFLKMLYFTTSFWTIDIFCSFTFGYYDGPAIEMRPKVIAARYLRTWSPLDFSLVCLDLAIIFGNDVDRSTGILRIGKSARLVRVMRLMRMIRFIKIMEYMGKWEELIPSQTVMAIMGILKLTAGIGLINHFIACAWYGVGMIDADDFGFSPHIGWVQQMEITNGGQPLDLGYIYTTALHWSWTQFTPASMEIVPRNTFERIFTIFVIIFALITFSSFISSITQTMTRLRDINTETIKQQEILRRYISDNKLSLELGNRIVGFAKTFRSRRSRLHQADIPVLKHLPAALRSLMRCELFMPSLTPHPLLGPCISEDEHLMESVCGTAMSELTLRQGQELFVDGQPADCMYFVAGGTLEYKLAGASSERLHTGDNFTEMSLWIRWDHQGRMVSGEADSELVTLEADAFRKIILRSRCLPHVQAYARAYQQVFIQEHTCRHRRMSDTWGTHDLKCTLASEAVTFTTSERYPPSRAAGMSSMVSSVSGGAENARSRMVTALRRSLIR